jgi:hypothetical protein
MTLKELVDGSGLNLSNKQLSKIGYRVKEAAKQAGITYGKKEQIVTVNDYPDEFLPTIQEIIINHLKSIV